MSQRRTIQDVYDLCVKIEKHAIKTNGKVELNKWVAFSALGISTFIAGALILVRIF